jgi:hypothetical protein
LKADERGMPPFLLALFLSILLLWFFFLAFILILVIQLTVRFDYLKSALDKQAFTA